MMATTKQCKQYSQNFTITDDDLAFLDKISPEFSGKKYQIPLPTLCPTCRNIRRLSFRNDFSIYRDKSSLSGEKILSIYSPDKKFPVYSFEEWWSDKWDALQFGREYNPHKKFFDQYIDLFSKVPRLNLHVDKSCEDCDFTSQIFNCRQCYLTNPAIDSEKCMYGYRLIRVKDTLDGLYIINCELCYECIDCNNCYNCQYIQDCSDCQDSSFLFNYNNCTNCIMCQGLRNKAYYYKNKKVPSEEFEKIKKQIQDAGRKKRDELMDEFSDFRKDFPVRFAELIQTENVTGHNVKNAKNCHYLFDAENAENCSYGINVNDAKDCFDTIFAAANTQLHLEVISTGVNAYNILFSTDTWPNVTNLIYCDNCSSSKDCFGCTGLKHKQHCVLNKQYGKVEYEKLVGQIIEKMIEDHEWGEFFPSSISPFGYNETTAMRYFPFTREEALRLEMNWQDKSYDIEYTSEFYEPLDKIEEYRDPVEQEKLLSGVIKCEASGRPFKILPKELAFYIENKIPIPTKHYKVRNEERFARRTPRKLWDRQCMCEESGHDHSGRCKNEFKTTYSPDRTELVYCERCYQKEII